MSIIKSISGIRGTIGGKPGDNLTPIDIVECTAGFGMWLKSRTDKTPKVVVGRDGRISGKMVSQISVNTLVGMGINVIDCGLSTTPTIEMMVTEFNADAGIIFTASHNPEQWNALKFLNHKGEFISAKDGEEILNYISSQSLEFAEVRQLGSYEKTKNAIGIHLDKILNYPLINKEAIKTSSFKVVVDCINSTGALSVPPLLMALDVEFVLINEKVNGEFAHNPEPLAKHLTELSNAVLENNAIMGISIDPDVDRLAFVNEDGSMFGEEYTLVAIADYFLSKKKGNTVSNLSSTRALADITKKYGGEYFASAVGEVNVVNTMKAHHAVIGGEGNGGIIVPDFHYGRDALIGIALFLSLLAERKSSPLELKKNYSHYEMIKDKIDLSASIDLQNTIGRVKNAFQNEKLNDVDGLKIDFENGWVHLRKSNTEPIIRIYAEAETTDIAQSLVNRVKKYF
ncbi:MAG: phosphoglucosamine mutase [Saprospiraceae bacterium]|nr:phosphoglucosamine mutase [Saprospiraceae bacterium]MCB9328470.1 phosphoglucosamine mutase [Lewinellaceae bacterium]